MKDYRFEFTGIYPLIMHWDNIDWQDQLELLRAAKKKSKTNKAEDKRGDDRNPPEGWKGCVYHHNDVVAIPHDNLRRCFITAGAKKELKGKETYKKLCASGIMLDPAYPLMVKGKAISHTAIMEIEGTYAEHKLAVEKLGFELYTKRAKIGQAKHVRVRPLFRNWSLAGTLCVTDDRIDTHMLTEICDIAGKEVGLGDWRPSAPASPGPFGRFTAMIAEL